MNFPGDMGTLLLPDILEMACQLSNGFIRGFEFRFGIFTIRNINSYSYETGFVFEYQSPAVKVIRDSGFIFPQEIRFNISLAGIEYFTDTPPYQYFISCIKKFKWVHLTYFFSTIS